MGEIEFLSLYLYQAFLWNNITVHGIGLDSFNEAYYVDNLTNERNCELDLIYNVVKEKVLAILNSVFSWFKKEILKLYKRTPNSNLSFFFFFFFFCS